MKHPVVPAILIVLVLVKSSLAIHCYNCNSVYDSRCADPFKGEIVPVDCGFDRTTGENATICRKLIQTIFKEKRIIRSCGYLQQDDPKKKNSCFRQSVTDATESVYCECDTHYCNSSGRLKASGGLLAALGFIFGWIMKLNCP